MKTVVDKTDKRWIKSSVVLFSTTSWVLMLRRRRFSDIKSLTLIVILNNIDFKST
jgi:hypothetical protein